MLFWCLDSSVIDDLHANFLFCRDDLQIPSSAYFPTYAQGGQGPPPMVQERFQSVVSQLFQHVRGWLSLSFATLTKVLAHTYALMHPICR